jgi:hypothetical protein
MNNNVSLRKKTDFNNDVQEFGPIGEERLSQILTSRNRRFDNTSNIAAFRAFDIDFIYYEDNTLTYRDLLKEYYNGNDGRNLALKSYECKTDTYALKSRNIVYEDISNSNGGCLARSKADYVFYVFIDSQTKGIKEEYMIDLHALRWWLCRNFNKINVETFTKTDANGTVTEKKLIEAKSMKRGKDNTGIFLIDIDYLVEYSKQNKGEIYGNIVPYYQKIETIK